MVNARCDVYLARVGGSDAERAQLVLERAERYRQAGADCLFVPGLAEIGAIADLVERAPLPVNVLLAPGRGPSITELRAAGVRRISVGHAIAAAAYTRARDATAALLADDDAPLQGILAPAELNGLLEHHGAPAGVAG